MSVPLWASTVKGASIGSAAITASNDQLTIVGNTLVEGQQIMFDTFAGGASGVLRTNAPYYVVNKSGDNFQVAPSAGAPVMLFTADGSAAAYLVAGLLNSTDLRGNFNGLLTPEASSQRTGFFPQGNESGYLTSSGGLWSTRRLQGIVGHSNGQKFFVDHPASTNNTVTTANPTQPRIDAIDLKVYASEFDGSGKVETELVYVQGVAEAVPSAPAVTASSERVGTILVPANNTSGAAVQAATYPKETVPIGGVVPVSGIAAAPGAGGRYKGMPVYDMATKILYVNTNAGSTYEAVASPDSYKNIQRKFTHTRTSNSSTFTSEAVISTWNVPVVAGKTYRLKWVVDVSSTVAGDTARIRVREDSISGTTRQLTHLYMSAANNDFGTILEADWVAPSTTTKTFVGTVHRAFGTGTFSCNANTSEPSSFTAELVEGI